MNWELFIYVGFIGLASGYLDVLSGRHTPTRAEARALLSGRLLAAGAIGVLIPHEFNITVVAALTVWESAAHLARAVAWVVDKALGRMEARRWLQR